MPARVASWQLPAAPRAAAPTAVPSPVSLGQRLAELLWQWQRRASERHQLAGLDDRLLSDIGLSRADAQREADKPFWRP